MTPQEAGIFLNLHRNTVHQYVRQGKLHATTTPKGRQQHNIILDRANVEAFQRERLSRSRSQSATAGWAKRKALASPDAEASRSPNHGGDYRILDEDGAVELARRKRMLAGQGTTADVEVMQRNGLRYWQHRGKVLVGATSKAHGS